MIHCLTHAVGFTLAVFFPVPLGAIVLPLGGDTLISKFQNLTMAYPKTLYAQSHGWPNLTRWRAPTKKVGVKAFFHSVRVQEWFWFLPFVATFLVASFWSLKKKYTYSLVRNTLMFAFWIFVAVFFQLIISQSLGTDLGAEWFTGYILELIFSLENIFIFASTMEMFSMPEHLVPMTLFIIVLWQNAMQLLLFMGLASWLQSIYVLPYILGCWLILVGIQTALHDDDAETEESNVVKLSKYCLGNRLTKVYSPKYRIIVTEDGKWRITLLGPALFVLLLFDLMMELDVTLTKIEEFSNHYVSFTSSSLASYVVPEIYFLVHEMFKQFPMLKYGITVILFYFGISLLFHRLFEVPDVANIGVMLSVIMLSVIVSNIYSDKELSDQAGEEA